MWSAPAADRRSVRATYAGDAMDLTRVRRTSAASIRERTRGAMNKAGRLGETTGLDVTPATRSGSRMSGTGGLLDDGECDFDLQHFAADFVGAGAEEQRLAVAQDELVLCVECSERRSVQSLQALRVAVWAIHG